MERACTLLGAVASLLTLASASAAQTSKAPQEIYAELKRFELGGGRAPAQNVVLMRDRAQITFATGTFYFAAPVAGKVRGAVFIGQGNFKAEVPNSPFERDHVRRMLKADTVESDFSTAVLRFTDDTFDVIGKGVAPGAAEAGAVKLASEFEARCLKETGANMASRLTISIVNQEAPGFFLAEFDKGKRGRFSVLLDYQTRIPVSAFSINGGEKGLIYAYNKDIFWNDVWMAFYGGEDYQKGMVNYSDAFDLVEIKSHKMDVDLREPAKRLKYTTELGIAVVADGLRALPLALNEGLGEYDSQRLKKALRVKGARLGDGKPATVVQEDWQAGLVVFFESPRNKGELFSLILDVEGDFMYDTVSIPDSNYPLSNETWFPRHGELARSSFDLTFVHKKNRTVASIGARVREEVNPENKDERITQWVMTQPVPIATFGIGPFERHAEKREIQQTGGKLDVEFYSLPGGIRAIKEDFILAELGNTVNYFDVLFGAYPYPRFGAIFHPFGYGIGYPSMLRIPSTDRASKYTYSFLAHETAHQWWGNIVAWRSYRDQWLSEGFAEYSGLLYTSRRDKPSSARELLISMRADLKNPPQTLTGLGKGKLSDVGPIILGHRLNTRESLGAYQALIYSKGGLVLRMLHFLFSNPANGDDKMFYGMMKDFVDRYRNGSASSDDFRAVANEHWPQTRLAQKYGQKDLNWFFRQWVYQTHLPTYRMEYKTRTDGGAVIVEGTVFQDNAPQDWFMPLPLVFQFEGNQTARGTVHALGPATPFAIKLPAMPRKIELDPDLWVLSEETSTKGK
jgi:hypothetical protein